MSGDEPTITFFFSSMSASTSIVSQQNHIDTVLTAKNINFVKVDIAACVDDKNTMRQIIGDEKALAPQLCNGDQYCGNYQSFSEANEDSETALRDFLKLPAKQTAES